MKLLSFHLVKLLSKTTLASLALGFLLAAGAPAAKANDWDDCNRRISYTEMRYNEAVSRFGPTSSQARHWAHERHEAYEHLEHLRLKYHDRY